MKYVKWGIPAVILLLLIVGIIVYININSIVRSTVETQASQSMNLQTRVGGANVSLFGRQVSLSELQIASPQGFPAPLMMSLNDVNVAVSIRELRQDPLRVSRIVLDRPTLVVEREGGRFNLQAAMDGMPPTDPEDELMLIIGHLEVREATVIMRPGLPGLREEITISLPTIALENVGTGEGAQNGVAISEVVMQVATAMAAKAAESDALPEELRALLALDMNQIAARLDQEFTRQFERFTEDLRAQVPEDVTRQVEQILRDPDTVREDPQRAVEEGLDALRGLRDRRPRQPAPPQPNQ
jgi:uncharacterized protein involved in outer membrane biogenesis